MNRSRLVAVAVLVAGAVTGAISACGDRPPEPSVVDPLSAGPARAVVPAPAARASTTGTGDGELATPADARGRAGIARITASEFHARNAMDWVGRMHNRGVEAWFADRKAHPKRSRVAGLCAELAAFSMTDAARLPGRTYHYSRAQLLEATRVALASTPTCAGKLRNLSSTPPEARFVFASTVGSTQTSDSLTVVDYFDQIDRALINSVDADDLASQLNAITSYVDAHLDANMRDVIDGYAAMVLASAEYWYANMERYEAMVRDQYGDCLRTAIIPEMCIDGNSIVGMPHASPPGGRWGFAKFAAGADVTAGAQTVLRTWFLGPIGWETAAATAAGASIVTLVAYFIMN